MEGYEAAEALVQGDDLAGVGVDGGAQDVAVFNLLVYLKFPQFQRLTQCSRLCQTLFVTIQT